MACKISYNSQKVKEKRNVDTRYSAYVMWRTVLYDNMIKRHEKKYCVWIDIESTDHFLVRWDRRCYIGRRKLPRFVYETIFKKKATDDI